MAGSRAVEEAAEGVIAKALKGSVRDAEDIVARDAAKDTTGAATRDAGSHSARDLDQLVGRTFDNEHPGPLSPSEAGTFTDGRYTVGRTEQTRTFYRAGDQGAPRNPHLGQYWTDTRPESVEAVRRESAVKEVWTDSGGNVTGRSPLNTGYAAEFPPGTTVAPLRRGREPGRQVHRRRHAVLHPPPLGAEPRSSRRWPSGP